MLSKFDYFKPKSIDEALSCLEKPDTRILAGGTDLMVLLRRNAVPCQHILDIKDIPETKKMEYTPQEGLFIGASITVNQVAKFPVVKEKYTALWNAANSLASYQLRNRATLVGNICNASPGADLAAPLLVLEAKVHVAGPKGKRLVDISEFFKGVKRTILEKNEFVLGVSLPDVSDKDKSIYLKQARIKGHDLATVGVAVRLTGDQKVLVAMSAVAPTPIRLWKLEEEMNAKDLTPELAKWAQDEVANHIRPISDVRSSAQYRLHVSGVLLKQGLMKLLEMEVH